MRKRVFILLAVCLGCVLWPGVAGAQWYGASTSCTAPYNYEGSGYLLSSCQGAAGYSGWGYGGAGASQYVTGGWAGQAPQWTRTDAWAGAAYSPWGYSVGYCRSWWGC